MAKFTNAPVVRQELLDYITKKLHCSKLEFAKMLDVSPATITKWLYSNTMPDTHVIRRMSRRLGLSYEEVLDLFE
ncbi:MAG: helix-turn-helix transcriptional regulator [Clostridia bacterium]|nr:helix-turn-helix transcriptional regulator [Clostridia bacterium]MBR7177537.1 helix-turn-helix transcriptional regulator [Clostridia bacterium]